MAKDLSTASDAAEPDVRHSLIDSNFPAFLPYFKELYMSDVEFKAFIESIGEDNLAEKEGTQHQETGAKNGAEQNGKKRALSPGDATLTIEDDQKPPRKSRFMDALSRSSARNADAISLAAENKMVTENGDLAYLSTNSALVDAFTELEDVASGDRLRQLLDASWKENPLATLKIIFNARSIHLGKSSRPLAYKAFGWLYLEHPRTLLTNLVWLVRPMIEKKVEKETKAKGLADSRKDVRDDDEEMVLIDGHDEEKLTSTIIKTAEGLDANDVQNGVSHGYWKDLLNLLALAAAGELRPYGDPIKTLQPSKLSRKPSNRGWDHEAAKRRKVDKLGHQHEEVMQKLEYDETYRALHFTVARLFAEQLKRDSARLAANNKEKSSITLAAKWAPSPKEAHDQRTFIVSSIAELLHDRTICPEVAKSDRETYLKHAREAYRRITISPLRKHLQVVEREITAKAYQNINYERLPSLALRMHQNNFIKNDFDRFNAYIEKVSEGEARVSGATLLPSTLIHDARQHSQPSARPTKSVTATRTSLKAKLLDGQWNTLVQRIRNSGKLQSSIAVCDVSGSMTFPVFNDGTCPMDSAIGLSLLLAEVCEPPFGGGFISFSANPSFHSVGGRGDKRSLSEKVAYIAAADWGMNTDFVAVFERLILPMAKTNRLKQEEMVKQVFVFSDMQFDVAQRGCRVYDPRAVASERWSSSFERVKGKFEEAGYEMPQLIFWNLAGGRRGGAAPKPVSMEDVGTALVSGYSQGQMKMFLDGGGFDGEDEEETIEEADLEDGDGEKLTEVKVSKEKAKLDPLSVVRKAISHPAYAMLTVAD